jgi:hypothetical protein
MNQENEIARAGSGGSPPVRCSTGKRRYSFLQYCKDVPRFNPAADLLESLATQGLPRESAALLDLLQEASDLWSAQ